MPGSQSKIMAPRVLNVRRWLPFVSRIIIGVPLQPHGSQTSTFKLNASATPWQSPPALRRAL